MVELNTDYLVIGAGASAMALVDTLVSETEADVVLVDRRIAPGGHWVDAYPFVRLHQPSAYYGVNSLPLGEDRVDTTGINAGFYERATADELRHYYARALANLESTGRVRFFGGTDYLGLDGERHVAVSKVSGRRLEIAVRRRLIDATYIQSVIPATHTPRFEVGEGATLITPNALADLDSASAGFTLVGGGKTAMDVGFWLLGHGVDPDRIRWIRPRDGWFTDRAYTQPLEQVGTMLGYQARMVEACATATTGLDLAHRLEEQGMMCRLDESVEGEIFRGATVARAELDALRTIENVVRLGRVRSIEATRLHLDQGSLPTAPGEIHIDCSAQGLATSEVRPIFDPGRITVQFTTLGVAPWSAAILGFVESLDIDDDHRNRLCQTVPRTGLIADQLWIAHLGFVADGARRDHREFAAWNQVCRLNPSRGVENHAGEPAVQEAFERMFANFEPAMANLATHAR
ncbi:MAG: hypothetical protein AAF962_11180 [Actinomycetota bacterium]